MIKCELLVGGYAYDVTDNLVNWDDVEMSWKRDDLDGVVRSFTTKFEFAGAGYSLLVNEYLKNYLGASASVVFYTRNNSWLWNERFRCALDFSNFSYNGNTCEINAIDDSLAALIKAKNGTQYEYSVDVIKEDEVLRYDRLVMDNKAEWMFPPIDDEQQVYKISKGINYLPLYLLETGEIAIKNIVEIYDVQAGQTTDDSTCMIRNISKNTLNITLNASFSLQFIPFEGYDVAGNCKVCLRVYSQDGTYTDAFSLTLSVSLSQYLNVPIVNAPITLKPNDYLVLIIDSDVKNWSYYFEEIRKNVSAEFVSRGETVDIPVVTPAKLLNRLLKSMNGGRDGLTGTIESDARLDNTVLVAAESIRGIENAKLYTSFNKFKEWMSSEFGFVPVIGEDSVSFVHRDSLFSSKKIKVLEDVTDFELSVDAGKIYSRVNVGYDKVDYESVNGKDEFRFTQQYTTGVDLSDSSLDLKSPYRADAYGIEFLAAKRGEDTTDSESDNDVFMVGVTLADGVYTVDRSLPISGVISPESMFNVMYSQRDMIYANMGYLSSFSNLIEYASSDGNSEVIIDGEGLKDDIELSNRLFTVGVMSVTTEDTDIPTDLSGVVEFDKNGKIYKGYVSEITLNIGRTESVTYKLIVKSVV